MCENKRLTPESILGNSEREASVSDYTDQKQGNKNSEPEDRVLSPSSSPVYVEEMVITRIRAADLALGLRRIPAGFYIAVQHSGLEWRTDNKRSSVNNDAVEWDGLIPIPSDLSAAVCLEIYASFEFQPMLGNGERLRQLKVTVEQILDHSGKDHPFMFFPEDGDVVSPCSSPSVSVGRWRFKSNDSPVSRVLDPHCASRRLVPTPSSLIAILPQSTVEGRIQLEIATDEGHSALSRFRKHGEKRDLERSIEQFGRALSICPPDHPCRAASQSNFAMAKFISCRVNDFDFFLDIPLHLYRDVLSARPVGHVDRSLTLIHLAFVHFVRFEKRQDELDVAQSEALLHDAMDLIPADSHQYQAASVMVQLHAGRKMTPVPAVQQDFASQFTNGDLCIQVLRRYEQSEDLDDLQKAISLLEGWVKSTSCQDPRYPALLQGFAMALFDRFRRLGALGDLEEAISTEGDAVQLTPNGHLDKPTRLNNLGDMFRTRFQRLKEVGDLERAISTFGDAVQLTSDGHPDKPGRLGNLGSSLRARFECFGEVRDLDQAISSIGDAVQLTPDDHPNKPGWLNSLGISFRNRFKRLGEFGDLERAISVLRDAVQLTPDGLPDPTLLNNLGDSFLTRFERLGELGDLEQAISTFGDAVRLTPDGHPDKPALLNNLGDSFRARFARLGELGDLKLAISMQGDAVQLTPDSHPDKPAWLNNLGVSFLTLFKHLGELGDLEQAISGIGDAVQLTPDGDPDRPGRLSNLGASFLTRFEHLGELSDLERAISRHGEAVQSTPDGHPDKPMLLNNIGTSFRNRFRRLGKLGDLDQAISKIGDAVQLTPDGHPDKPGRLSNLGNSFLNRFERLGELGDLEWAISRLGDAVQLTPDGHPDKPTRLNNLGTSFLTRFQRLGELGDLERAILRIGDAVQLTPDGHPDKPARLTSLANYLRTRFECLGELSDLEHAISRIGDAVQLTPDGHPDKPARLNNLGISFLTRFERLEELSDLEQTISAIGDAVQLTPDAHPDKSTQLSNLGNALLTRFERLGELGDLERATSMTEIAVELTPDGHPDKPGWLNSLANCFVARCEHLEDLADLERAISLYSHSSQSTGPPTVRFKASLLWIGCARILKHHTLLQAYSMAINLLPQLAWIGLSLPHRYRELMRGADVVREAAAAALDSGLPETAVEWLEQGRSVVWGELFQLRSSYEELSTVHPDYAHRLQELSTALEHASATREKSLSLLSDPAHGAVQAPLEEEASQHRMLAIERDRLLQEIRLLPGFERFLLHKEFSQLRSSAHSGPVVILNATESRYDALIVLADVENVLHVPLPNMTPERSEVLQASLESVVRDAHAIPLGEREGKGVPQDLDLRWESILSSLWKCVVKPVLDSLAFMTPGQQSRIFWCPTGSLTFLPIHAAGFYHAEYSHPGHKVYDFVVSSYTPTLSILAPLPELDAESHGDLRFLAVRQPPSDGLSRLPGVDAELRHIKAIIGHSPSARVTLQESSSGTVEEVIALMREADWVHFACHGIQDAANPTDSGLCLADERRLKLTNIIALSRPRSGGLAFLSACQTATGDRTLSDEAIHIAAGMLFAGYGGVVGTMWAISDRLAPGVAMGVYERLFSKGMRPDYREAARALQDAVQRLRDDGASFSEWIPFIHVGL